MTKTKWAKIGLLGGLGAIIIIGLFMQPEVSSRIMPDVFWSGWEKRLEYVLYRRSEDRKKADNLFHQALRMQKEWLDERDAFSGSETEKKNRDAGLAKLVEQNHYHLYFTKIYMPEISQMLTYVQKMKKERAAVPWGCAFRP